MLHTILIVFAFVLEICAMLTVPSRVNLMAAGLACYFATLLF